MDENQIIDNIHDENSNLYLTKEARESLYKTGNWAMGFAILGFLGVGIGLLSSISVFAMGGLMAGQSGAPAWLMPLLGVFYIALTLIFAVPVWKQFKFAQQSKDAARRMDSNTLANAMKNLHAYYKWYGILAIIVVVTYIIALIGAFGFLANAGAADGFQF